MKPWIHLGHAPLLALLIIAAVPCLMILAEFTPGRLGGLFYIIKAAPPGKRAVYAMAGIAAMLLASVVLFLIAFFVWFSFGPFYLLISALLIIFIVIPALALLGAHWHFGHLTPPQLISRAIAVIAVSLTLAFMYMLVAN